MSEPITALTDFVLAAITAFWAIRVFRASDRRASRLFAIALAATALSTLLGGLYHTMPGQAIWKATALSVGLVSFFLGLSVAIAFLSPRATRIVRVVLLVQLCVYAIAVMLSDDFWIVIADYGSVMLAILIVCARRARWIVAAILISFVASAFQVSSVRIGPLNHNDIYHVIDVVALYCFYRGGMELSRARPSIQPT